jgi:hypothetical protein
MSIIRVVGSLADLDTYLNMASTTSNVDASVAKEGFVGSGTAMGRLNISPVSELWVNWRHTFADLTNTTVISLISFFNTSFSTTQALFRLLKNGAAQTDGIVRGQYWDGSAWVNIGGGPFTNSVNTEETLHIKMDEASGIFRRYRNTVLDGELLGDTIRTAAITIDRIEFASSSGTGAQTFSEIIIATTDIRGRRLQRLEPTADGANTAWTGTFADVDETGVGDSDYISSNTANQVETFVVADIAVSLAAAHAVEGVVISVRARKGEAGPQNLQAVLRTNSTDFVSSNYPTLNTVFQGGLQKIWETNPDTAAAWTQSEVNAIEVGVKSIA